MTLSLREDIACFYEGSTEKAILDLLIDANMLIFDRDNLVDEDFLSVQDISTKNIENFCQRVLLQVDQADKMDIVIVQDRPIIPKFPKLYTEKIGGIYVLQTKPEIEMLLIHHYNLFSEFQKVKSKLAPKEFLSQYLKIPKKELTSYRKIQEKYSADVFQRAAIEQARNGSLDKGMYQLAEILN